MDKTKQFIKLFKKAEKKYGKSERRLAAEGLKKDWQVLITTIMSAQSRDETTIKIANQLFKKYLSLISLSKAKYSHWIGIKTESAATNALTVKIFNEGGQSINT